MINRDRIARSLGRQATRSSNDTKALEEIAAVLGAIIARDEKRGLPTTGLENSKREIEWAARQGCATADGACKHSWETDPHGDVICEKCHTLKSETKDE